MKLINSVYLLVYLMRSVTSKDCYWNRECKYKYLGSKTPYENVRGDIRDSYIRMEGCEPISIWTIIRHGKRNPGIKFIRDIKEALGYKNYIVFSHKNGNSSLCAQDVQNLNKYNIDMALLDKPNELSVEGYQEMFGIGNRLKEVFPELLHNLKTDQYLFIPAFGQRMLDSAEAFIAGLEQEHLTINKNISDYHVLAPYAACEQFQSEVFLNLSIFTEVNRYVESTDYLIVKERIKRKLGLNFTLSNKNIIGMYDLCRYPWDGIKNKPSPWCAVFSNEDLKVLEYIDDLRHYYRNGYGAFRFSSVFGQIPLADLLSQFVQAKEGNGRKIVSYITHATMMDMILVALNVNDDEQPLTGTHRNMNRKWKSSISCPFSSNFIAVLNRCRKPHRKEYDHNIAFYWNEKPLLEICNAGVCSWQQFEDKFKVFLNTTLDLCEFKAPLK